MIEIEIEESHGYLLDENNRVVLRFGNWKTGMHNVPDSVETVEYVDGPNAHDRDIHDDYLDV